MTAARFLKGTAHRAVNVEIGPWLIRVSGLSTMSITRIQTLMSLSRSFPYTVITMTRQGYVELIH